MRGDGCDREEDGKLTFLGRVLAHLPVDLYLGKMIVLGHAFGCLDESLIIGEQTAGVRVHPLCEVVHVPTAVTLTLSCLALPEEFLCLSVDAAAGQSQVSLLLVCEDAEGQTSLWVKCLIGQEQVGLCPGHPE